MVDLAPDDGADPSSAGRGPAHVELTETRSGWTLTITLPADLLEAVRDGLPETGRRAVPLDGLTMSVEPNLVPGAPFRIDSVQVVRTEPDQRDEPERGDEPPER